MPRLQLLFLPYVVFHPYPVTVRSPSEKGASLIPPPWYTSGKLSYAGKSDHTGTVIR
uniref:Uncharacterized protein n=1 Tax=Leclercia adecarboxylata TaxID=83655 RepID=A0A482LYV3_9ENTR|nr:Hypothetical protein [Leclercia adecarboxylata]